MGAGGMGEVYRARHVKLRRPVAIKVLRGDVASDRERLERFEREARSASSLNHPNIVTIYDIAEHEGTTYIAMELVEGRTLRELLKDGPLSVGRAVGLARQICEGLGKAHAAGIVHRDLKPENLMVTDDGLAKILDFGLAKAVDHEAPGDSAHPTRTKATSEGIILGTVHYMSPEQASGRIVDHRSDQFSLGIVLYELLSGKRPFEGPTAGMVVSAILRDAPPPLRSVRPEIDEALARVLNRCLEKDREARFGSIGELRGALLTHQDPSAPRRRLALRRIALAAVVAAAVVAAGLAWTWVRSERARSRRNAAVQEITRLADAGDLSGAYRLGVGTVRQFPGDPGVQEVLQRITLPLPINTNPPGADIFVKSYGTPDAPWEHLGRTPIDDVGIPYALMRWKIEKEGFETIEAAPFGQGSLTALAMGIPLEPKGSRPPGMVQVPAGLFEGAVGIEIADDFPAVELSAYWIDRNEVTHRDFKAFVDAGGYESAEHWSERFVKEGRELSWEEATASFRDATGRPGPATWQLGTFPIGADDLPVSGVNWYEAAAYCEFVEKSLPTLYHWFRAAEQAQVSDILSFSNFAPDGPAPAGTYEGLGPYGTLDMAGNVKEWCFSENDDGLRYVLGGSAGEPVYMYTHLVAEDPFDRSSSHGIRCARYVEPPGAALLRPVARSWNFSEGSPASDAVVDAYFGLYDYDRVALNPRIDSLDDESPHWRLQTVSYDAAYGGERVTALVFLPRNAAAPFQTVVWFPGNDVFMSRSRERLASSYLFDFIPQSGRALVYPIYKGMYERFMPFSRAPNEFRERMVYWSKDLGRTLDYLETRDDIASDKIAYYGFSAGALYGPIFSAIDTRFRASILLAGGLHPIMTKRPEIDLTSFAPRSRVPTLMINGRDDFLTPYEISQLPLFQLLGAPDSDKRHARLDGGHIPDRLQMMTEVLRWLDRYLGPVTPDKVSARP